MQHIVEDVLISYLP